MLTKLRRTVAAALLFVLSLSWLPMNAFAANCPCSIWSPTTTPTNANVNDPSAVELGVKFRANTAGSITGIRFYKGAQNTGTHIGNLWTRTGTKLATATFTNETASGWQQANFSNPVNITANTTYIASYYAPVGRYAADNNYFASSATVNGPLTALRNGTDGGNGVYKYGTSGFPTFSFQSSNYWVDVVFQDNVADTMPPTVAGTNPVNGTTNVSVSTDVAASFKAALYATTVSSSTFELRDQANALVPAAVSYNATSQTAT